MLATMSAPRTRLSFLLPQLALLVNGECTGSTLLNPLGSDRSYSTVYDNDPIGFGYARSMLNSVQAWSAGANNFNQQMTIDAGIVHMVHGIATQGRYRYDQWVTSYSVQVSRDGAMFTDVDGGASFTANSDNGTVVNACFSTPVSARYVRIKPKSWNNHISMRAALYVTAVRLSGSSAKRTQQGWTGYRSG